MSKLKKRLDYLKKDDIKKRWETIESREDLSTKDKLDKLVKISLKRKKKQKETERIEIEQPQEENTFIQRDFSYPLQSVYGKVKLTDWQQVTSQQLAVLFGEEEFLQISPMKLLFFDTETTGLSGGTGTIPFLLGFGFFEEDRFNVKIFILNDLSREEEFLTEVDQFLESRDYSGVVTYNGKGFDFPLMETRYILYRKRFPLLKTPHLDFLYPARVLWKNTYESRKLGYLGDVLLGLSRGEDIDSSQVPMLYFNYLRSNAFELIEKVVQHNALDLVGLSALLLLGIKYVDDISFTNDEGEILGAAVLYEKYGDFDKANELYGLVKKSAARADTIAKAVKRKSIIVKRKKLYDEAKELWKILSHAQDRYAVRELSVHFEHREKDYFKALEFVRRGLETIDLTEAQRADFEKRFQRLNKKIKALEP
ncbi:MAG: ribonuclease H-like domain-containing protein, partial [Candidatus Aminicenantes bacterium]|nr:ribonuclease H-like domain-containing protein [Candidatus Aminicenantes bacterium]